MLCDLFVPFPPRPPDSALRQTSVPFIEMTIFTRTVPFRQIAWLVVIGLEGISFMLGRYAGRSTEVYGLFDVSQSGIDVSMLLN
jgi:hypothetical protein